MVGELPAHLSPVPYFGVTGSVDNRAGGTISRLQAERLWLHTRGRMTRKSYLFWAVVMLPVMVVGLSIWDPSFWEWMWYYLTGFVLGTKEHLPWID